MRSVMSSFNFKRLRAAVSSSWRSSSVTHRYAQITVAVPWPRACTPGSTRRRPSLTEPASRVERARILPGYWENSSFFAVGQALGLHHQTVQRSQGTLCKILDSEEVKPHKVSMIGQHDDRAFYRRRRWERSELSETWLALTYLVTLNAREALSGIGPAGDTGSLPNGRGFAKMVWPLNLNLFAIRATTLMPVRASSWHPLVAF